MQRPITLRHSVGTQPRFFISLGIHLTTAWSIETAISNDMSDMNALRPKFFGKTLRKCPQCPFGARECREADGGFNACCCAGEKEGGRILRVTLCSFEKKGYRLLCEYESAFPAISNVQFPGIKDVEVCQNASYAEGGTVKKGARKYLRVSPPPPEALKMAALTGPRALIF